MSLEIKMSAFSGDKLYVLAISKGEKMFFKETIDI